MTLFLPTLQVASSEQPSLEFRQGGRQGPGLEAPGSNSLTSSSTKVLPVTCPRLASELLLKNRAASRLRALAPCPHLSQIPQGELRGFLLTSALREAFADHFLKSNPTASTFYADFIFFSITFNTV